MSKFSIELDDGVLSISPKTQEMNISSSGEEICPEAFIDINEGSIELNWGKSDFARTSTKEELASWIKMFS